MHLLPRLLLFFLLLLCSAVNLLGGDVIDSLKQELGKAKSDSLRIVLQQRLGNELMPLDDSAGWSYYQKALGQADDKNLIDQRVSIRVRIGRELMKQGNTDSAISVVNDALRLASNEAYHAGIIESAQTMARVYFLRQQNDSIIKYFEVVAASAAASENHKVLSTTYSNLGLLYQYQSQFEKANSYNFKGLALKEQIQDPESSIASSHNNIALSYQELGKFEEAIKHQIISLEIYLELSDSANIATRYYMLGGIHYQMEALDTAKRYYDKAFAISQRMNDQANISVYYTYDGLISMKKGKLREAASSFRKSLETFPENGQKRAKVFIFSNLAEVHLKMGVEPLDADRKSLLSSIDYAEQTLELATGLSFLDQMRKASELLYEAYDALGQSSKAMVYAKKYIQLNDSIYNDQKQKAVEEIQTKYETEKKEDEIAFLDRENSIKEQNLEQGKELQKNQKLIILLLALGVLATAGLLGWIYRIYVQKKNANETLELKNNIISQQNDEKDLLLKEIHHRVKNNLQVVSSLLDLQSMDLDNEEALAAVTDGQNRVKAMALIHEKLYQNENIVNLNFADYATQLMTQTAAIFPGMGKVKRKVQADGIELDIDTAVPLGLILSELLTNAYKYAFPLREGELSIFMEELDPGKYKMTVRDTGAGLPADFDLKKSSSLGLKLVRRLSKQLYGQANYETDGGAVFHIVFSDTALRKQSH